MRIRLLMVWTVLVAAATLAPFDFGSTAHVHAHSFGLFEYGPYERSPVDFVLNVLLFLPMGALLDAEWPWSPRERLLRIAGLAFVWSAVLEYLQHFLPTRDSSLIDVIANTTGAVAGIFVARRFGDALTSGIRRQRARTSTIELAATLVVVLIVSLLASGALQARSRLTNWSPNYPLLIGNERTGDRPWRGQVFAITITNDAAGRGSMKRFAADGSITLPGERIAGYSFAGDDPYRDVDRRLPALSWTGVAPPPAPAGVVLTGTPWLQSEGPADRLTTALQASNAFSIRVVCAASDTDQDGPARILSNSVSPYARNFTLGQQGKDLVVRLRTPRTGLNGYPLETYVEDAFATTAVRDIVVTYDGATLLAAVAREGQVVRTSFTPATAMAPLLSQLSSLPVRADQLPGLNAAYVAALFLVPGVLIAVLGRSRRAQLTLFGLYLFATMVLFEATLVAASGRPFDFANVAVNGAIGALVLSVIGVIVLPADKPRRPLRAGWLAAQTWS